MQKKHTFSPNHKVVSGKHNFHEQGQPSTATMGAPPQSVGGGASGENGPSDGGSGGGMDGMNFCDGGKFADGGDVDTAPTEQGTDTGRGFIRPETGPDAGVKRWKGADTGKEANVVLPDGSRKSPMQIADEES